MSFRPQLTPQPVIVNGDMSADILSSVTIIQKISMPSYSVTWNGTSPVGSLSVQVSNDYSLNADGTVDNAGTWNTLSFQDSAGNIASSIAVSGDTGTALFDILQTSTFAMQLVYTAGSGVGVLDAVITGKVS